MTPDWSKAPAGATHFTPPIDDSGMYLPVYYRKEGDRWPECWQVTDGGGFNRMTVPTMSECSIKRMIARPVEPWGDTDLPPVGVECEYLWEWSGRVIYIRVRVLSHDLGKAQFRVLEGGAVHSIRETEQSIQNGHAMFRPLRTPEQIAAAAERQRAVHDAINDIGATIDGLSLANGRSEAILAIVGAMHDAGYRKVSP